MDIYHEKNKDERVEHAGDMHDTDEPMIKWEMNHNTGNYSFISEVVVD